MISSISGSTISLSSCSSRGSISTGSQCSLSASSRGSWSSLNYLDMYSSGSSEAPNLRELHQRILDLLQGMTREAYCPPIYETRTSGSSTSYISTSGLASQENAASSQVSLSSRDSLSISSLSPPVSPNTVDQSPVPSPGNPATLGETTTYQSTDTDGNRSQQVGHIVLIVGGGWVLSTRDECACSILACHFALDMLLQYFACVYSVGNVTIIVIVQY